VVGAALVAAVGRLVVAVGEGALVTGVVGDEPVLDGVEVDREVVVSLDVGAALLVGGGADDVVGTVDRVVLGAAGVVATGWVVLTPVVPVVGAEGWTLR
jgi:hypothetical protein